ncbi:hypothetical protein CRYUN_Cryun18bG0043700 [Craigia yunnanensis]
MNLIFVLPFQFGVFGICDGHGGVNEAKSVSKILPEMVATILSNSVKRERVLSQCDASDVLRDAFSQTEACMNNYYEIKMTEDHKVTSYSERLLIEGIGEPLKDGETRLCGLNLARMLGDKFVKQQDSRFSFEPYISQIVHINQISGAFALLAKCGSDLHTDCSDGFWDVVSIKKAIQLVAQTRERHLTVKENLAEKIANVLLNEAKTLRTKDNTSIIFLDFDSRSRSRISCKVDS